MFPKNEHWSKFRRFPLSHKSCIDGIEYQHSKTMTMSRFRDRIPITSLITSFIITIVAVKFYFSIKVRKYHKSIHLPWSNLPMNAAHHWSKSMFSKSKQIKIWFYPSSLIASLISVFYETSEPCSINTTIFPKSWTWWYLQLRKRNL